MLKTKQLSKSNLLLIIETFICFIIVSTTIFELDSISSLAFYVLFFTLIIHLCFVVEKNITFAFLLTILSTALLFVLLDIILSNGIMKFNINYIKKYLSFASILIYFYIISMTEVSRKTYVFVINVFALLGLVFVISYFLLGIRTSITDDKLLTMNFSNPNLFGMFAALIALYVLMFLVNAKKWIFRILAIVLLACMVYLVYLSGSRSSLVSVIVFGILFIIYANHKKRKMGSFSIALLLLIPIIYVVLYFTLNEQLEKLFGIIDSNKGFDTRIDIWNYALNSLKNHFLIGSYYGISGGTGASQMHNTLLDVACSYGLIILLLVLVYVHMVVKGIIPKINTKTQVVALLSFFAAWIMGSGEASLFSGGQGIYILSCAFLLLAKYDKKKENQKLNR